MKTKNVVFHALSLSILLTSLNTAADSKNKSNLSTNIRFDGATVNGKNHKPFGVSTTVEAEKVTPTLIDYRSNFDDRMARSKTGR